MLSAARMQAKRWWTAGAVIALLLAVWLAITSRPSTSAIRHKDPITSTSARSSDKSERRRPPPHVSTGHMERPPVDNIVIERVEVSKQEVCKGEDVVVTVHAESKDKEEQYLSYGALGRPDIVGPRFTLQLQESLGYDWLKVFVQGKYGTSTVASVPPVLVKDCEAPVSVSIDVERKAAAFDRAMLTARVTAPDSAQPFVAIEYEWDFGDGTSLKSERPQIEHSYEGRPHTSAYSYFFITVKARDAGGRVAEASRSLRFVNLGFIPLADRREVQVFTGARSAGAASDSEKIWLYHGAPYAVRVERVIVKDVTTDAAGAQKETNRREYDALGLLGFADLPPGQSRETRDLNDLRPTSAGTTRILELTGRGPGGSTVVGAFTLLPPQAELASSAGETPAGSEEEQP